MFGDDRQFASPALFEDCKRDEASSEALDQFKSALIVAYEQALEDGMSSGTALAAMIDVMSIELKRCTKLAG
jgi:hypothetical protein